MFDNFETKTEHVTNIQVVVFSGFITNLILNNYTFNKTLAVSFTSIT